MSSGYVLHNLESGLPEHGEWSGPTAYAGHLARYISCPSTIRSRVLDQYGRGPSVDECKRLRERHIATHNQWRSASESLEPVANDASDFRVRGLVKEETREGKRRLMTPDEDAGLPVYAPVSRLRKAVIPSEIIAEIATAFCIKPDDILGRSRKRYVVEARNVVCYVLRERGSSFPSIGGRLGRDHSTVLHAYENFKANATLAMRQVAARFLEGGDE